MCVLIWLKESEQYNWLRRSPNVTDYEIPHTPVGSPNARFAVPQLDEMLPSVVPVALVYNGIFRYVVMMALQKDLTHFGNGVSLSEAIIDSPRNLWHGRVVPSCNGLEVQIDLPAVDERGAESASSRAAARTGCGVCVAEQLNISVSRCKSLPFSQTFNLATLIAR